MVTMTSYDNTPGGTRGCARLIEISREGVRAWTEVEGCLAETGVS